MGFHKRWLDEEYLRICYEQGGVEKLKLVMKADAFILEDEFSSKFMKVFEESTREELEEKLKQHFNVPRISS